MTDSNEDHRSGKSKDSVESMSTSSRTKVGVFWRDRMRLTGKIIPLAYEGASVVRVDIARTVHTHGRAQLYARKKRARTVHAH